MLERKSKTGGIMRKKIFFILLTGILVFTSHAAFGFQSKLIDEIIQDISKDNVKSILQKLESFQTRHVNSSEKEGFGIKSSSEWIHKKFSSLSPRLKVSFDTYVLPPQGRRFKQEMTMRNVMAVLPGRQTGDRERIYLVNAHYDTFARAEGDRSSPENFDNFAPGVNDDGSGVAALIEMARAFSRYEFDATVYFVAFTAEEIGLVGSTLLAARLKNEKKTVDGVITLDMIGNIEGGNGVIDNKRMRVFSAGPADSLSRQLARYAKKTGERFFPAAQMDCISRADRFGRGGDHTPFVLEGWAGIRMMEANENFSRQHSVNDTLENMSVDYCTRNIRIVSSILASLASAPPAPNITNKRGRPLLGRGKNRYSANLRWNPVSCDDLAGYKVYWRKTTAPFWEKEAMAGMVTEYTLENVTIDEFVFGVSAIDKDGNESLTSAYTMAPRNKRTYEVKK
jgi:hypothetical protein